MLPNISGILLLLPGFTCLHALLSFRSSLCKDTWMENFLSIPESLFYSQSRKIIFWVWDYALKVNAGIFPQHFETLSYHLCVAKVANKKSDVAKFLFLSN